MVVTYRDVNKLVFPVYFLPSSNWNFEDGLLFLDNRLVDDRNVTGDNIGIRRLKSPLKDFLPLKKNIKTILGLIKNKSGTPYIDYSGTPFIYRKTEWCELKYHKIKKIDRKEVASIIWLRGIEYSFKVSSPPSIEFQWVGVLYKSGFPWILYEYSKERKKDTRRKI